LAASFFEHAHSPLQQAQHASATLTAADLQQAQQAALAVSFFEHAHSPLQQAQHASATLTADLQQALQALTAEVQQPLQAPTSFLEQHPASLLQQPQHALATAAIVLQQAPQPLAAAAQLLAFLQQPVLHEAAASPHGVLQSSLSQQLPHSSFLPHSDLPGLHGLQAASGQASVQAAEGSSQGYVSGLQGATTQPSFSY
jgi:hypothetical protein